MIDTTCIFFVAFLPPIKIRSTKTFAAAAAVPMSSRASEDMYENYGQCRSIFACPNCNSKFKYKGNLSEHMKVQCGKKKSFQCHICQKEFAYKQNMKTHLGIVHKVLMK